MVLFSSTFKFIYRAVKIANAQLQLGHKMSFSYHSEQHLHVMCHKDSLT